MKDYAAWIIMFIIAILLMVAGFQGSLGRMLCVTFAPSQLVVGG